MAAVGLSFGSATSGTGFDVATTVAAILANEDGIQTTEQTQLTALTAQDTVFSTLGTDLSTLTTNLQALTDADGTFATKEGSSSNTNILTLTNASSSAVAGTHSVVVSNLATTASAVSSEIATATDTLSGSLTINGTQVNVVSGTSDTLATFATAINDTAGVGVTASIITDAGGSRLSLVSNTSGGNADGSAVNVAITGTGLTDSTTSTAVTFPSGQTTSGVDALLTVDNIQIYSASNTVTGAIAGVTFQLVSGSPGSSVQIVVANDNDAIETAVSSLVTSYNAVIKDLSGQEQNDASGNPEPLFGSPTLSLIQSQLQTAIFSGTAVGSINSVTQLGIETQSDGTLTLNNSTLDAALNSNFSDVTSYFQNTGSFGQNFSSVLNGLGTQAPGGAVYLAQQQNSTQEASLNAELTTQKAASAVQSAALTAELNTANQELQAIPSQLTEINEIYSSISGYNQNTGE